MNLRKCHIVAALTVAAVRAQAQETGSCNVSELGTVKVPFAMIASGGIAKGAYQAGALWALLESMKATRYLRTHKDTVPVLGSITGASAGNVNSLLIALEWATPLDTATKSTRNERTSYLWKTWTSVGIDGLLPENGISETPRSIVDPGAFDKVRKALVDASSRDTLLRCHIPIGITLTRTSHAGKYPVLGARDAIVQRYASVAVFDASSPGFVLQLPDSETVANGAGVVIVAPVDTLSKRNIDVSLFFDHIQASAAFPLAFPPTLVRFFDYPKRDPRKTCGNRKADTTCAEEQHDYFLDGGVYDNSPISLAMDLMQGNSRQSQHSRLWFVSPGQRRNPLDIEPVKQEVVDSHPFGAIRYLKFASSVIDATGDYELYALQRRLEREGRPCGSAGGQCLDVTTRHFPIYGATAGSFGAFLGKPLREIDFYIGVYDGLLAALGDSNCVGVRAPAAHAPSCHAAVNSAIDDRSTSNTVLPELSSEGRRLVRAIADAEFGRTAQSTPETGRVARLLDLFSELNISASQKHPECAEFSFAVGIFCEDGLRGAIIAHKYSPFKNERLGLDNEPDERRFTRLVEDFDDEIYHTVKPAINQQRRVEAQVSSGIVTGRIAKLLQFFVDKDYNDARRGLLLEPSSVPYNSNENGRLWPHALPYQVDLWSGAQRATWSPTFVLPDAFAFGLGPSILRSQNIPAQPYTTSLWLTGRVRTPEVFLIAPEIDWSCAQVKCRDYMGTASLTAFSLLRVGAAFQNGTFGESRRAWRSNLLIGLSDFPAFIHLLAR